MNKSILYLLFCFSTINLAQSNKVFKKTYTKQDGINIDNINSICYDNDGFLWFGGSNLDNRSIILSDRKLVLQRFNGNSFHDIDLPVYDNPIQSIEHIYKRKDGLFYIIAKLEEGIKLLLFDPYTAVFNPVNLKGFGFYLDGLTKVFGYKGEDYLLAQKGTIVTLIKLDQDLSYSEVFSFTHTKSIFLMGSSSKIIPFKDFVIISDDNFNTKIFKWDGTLIKVIDKVKTSIPIEQKRVIIDETFTVDNSRYVFLYKNSDLYKINETNQSIDIVKGNSLSNVHLKTFNDAFGNAMLFASTKDLFTIYSLQNQQLKQDYQLKIKGTNGIKIASQDLNKEAWIATDGKLYYLKFKSKTIKTFMPTYAFRDIKPLDTTNYLVVTENDGWYKINPTQGTVKDYPLTMNGKDFKTSTTNLIIEDSTIWGNGYSGILKIDRKTKNVKSLRHYPATYLKKINDSIIIYATNGYNLMQFNTKTELHKALIKTDSLDVSDFHILDNSNLLVASTNKGLLTYDLKSKKSNFYADKKDLKDPYLLMVDYHKDYGYLLGSRSGIIYSFNPESNTIKTLYKDELKAGIATILFDNDTWWINTFNGYVAFNINNKTQTRFSEKDGFSHYEANRYSALKTKDGFFIGAIKGLNYFKPSELKPQKDLTTLTLLKVKSYNKTTKQFKNNLNRSHLDLNNSIVLPSENRALEVDFSLKNTNAVNKGYTYKYRLDQKDWVELKDKNSIQFPNLAAGSYTLEIEADDFSGDKIGDSLLVNINSTEFFYKKWWFFLLISVGAISILLWMLNQTNIRRRLQEQFSQGLIQSQEDERKRIARELHDSISQQLTLIKKKAQNTNQDEITSLTHNTLEEVRAISRGLYPPLLKQLGLTESIEQLILEVDEQTNLFVSGEVDKIDTYFNEDQTLNCYRFIQECINNCLKHAEAKALSVSVLKEHNSIEITIKDNGKGFDVTNAQKQNSLGLKTIYERIRILKGELTIDSKPNKGTTIIAIITTN